MAEYRSLLHSHQFEQNTCRTPFRLSTEDFNRIHYKNFQIQQKFSGKKALDPNHQYQFRKDEEVKLQMALMEEAIGGIKFPRKRINFLER